MVLLSRELDPAVHGVDSPRPPSRRGRRVRTLVITALYLPLWAGLCNLILELSIWWRMPGPAFYKVFAHGYGFMFGTLMLTVLLTTLLCVTNRLWLSLGLLLALAVTVAAVNRVKLGIRSEPVYPSDLDFLTQPRFLLDMVSPTWLAALTAGKVGIVVASTWMGRRMERTLPRIRRSQARWWWPLLALRVLVGLIAVSLLVSATGFNEPGNGWRRMYDSKNAHWRFWYQRLNYRDNGFVGGLLYNMPTPAMLEPPGYNRATMTAIASKYARLAAAYNQGRSAGALDDVNVVVVLSEAFSDPLGLDGFELERDPIPHTRRIMSESASGTMLAQQYGGGTANMEFETLTGQSLALFEPQLNTPYQQLVPRFASYPSVVSWFEDRGHRPVAVHPYFTGMYKRSAVYAAFGFDDFIHDSTLQRADRIDDSKFISDASAFHEVSHQIEVSEQPVFVNLVTMQNHVPVTDTYTDPIRVTGTTGDQGREIGQYARGLEHSDAALREWLNSLEGSSERTIVVFFGDHQPGIYGTEITDQNAELAVRKTPFFIWDSSGNRPQELGITSPLYFMPLLFDIAREPVPPVYALLKAAHQRVPAMEQGRYLTGGGEERSESELSAVDRAILADLRLVQYDLSIGKRYALDRLWPRP